MTDWTGWRTLGTTDGGVLHWAPADEPVTVHGYRDTVRFRVPEISTENLRRAYGGASLTQEDPVAWTTPLVNTVGGPFTSGGYIRANPPVTTNDTKISHVAVTHCVAVPNIPDCWDGNLAGGLGRFHFRYDRGYVRLGLGPTITKARNDPDAQEWVYNPHNPTGFGSTKARDKAFAVMLAERIPTDRLTEATRRRFTLRPDGPTADALEPDPGDPDRILTAPTGWTPEDIVGYGRTTYANITIPGRPYLQWGTPPDDPNATYGAFTYTGDDWNLLVQRSENIIAGEEYTRRARAANATVTRSAAHTVIDLHRNPHP